MPRTSYDDIAQNLSMSVIKNHPEYFNVYDILYANRRNPEEQIKLLFENVGIREPINGQRRKLVEAKKLLMSYKTEIVIEVENLSENYREFLFRTQPTRIPMQVKIPITQDLKTLFEKEKRQRRRLQDTISNMLSPANIEVSDDIYHGVDDIEDVNPNFIPLDVGPNADSSDADSLNADSPNAELPNADAGLPAYASPVSPFEEKLKTIWKKLAKYEMDIAQYWDGDFLFREWAETADKGGLNDEYGAISEEDVRQMIESLKEVKEEFEKTTGEMMTEMEPISGDQVKYPRPHTHREWLSNIMFIEKTKDGYQYKKGCSNSGCWHTEFIKKAYNQTNLQTNSWFFELDAENHNYPPSQRNRQLTVMLWVLFHIGCMVAKNVKGKTVFNARLLKHISFTDDNSKIFLPVRLFLWIVFNGKSKANVRPYFNQNYGLGTSDKRRRGKKINSSQQGCRNMPRDERTMGGVRRCSEQHSEFVDYSIGHFLTDLGPYVKSPNVDIFEAGCKKWICVFENRDKFKFDRTAIMRQFLQTMLQ